MRDYQDRYPEILTGYLGEELYQEAKDRGLSDNRMMAWYHSLGRDQELFKERVASALEETSKASEAISRTLENLRTQIQKLERIDKEIVEKQVIQE